MSARRRTTAPTKDESEILYRKERQREEELRTKSQEAEDRERNNKGSLHEEDVQKQKQSAKRVEKMAKNIHIKTESEGSRGRRNTNQATQRRDSRSRSQTQFSRSSRYDSPSPPQRSQTDQQPYRSPFTISARGPPAHGAQAPSKNVSYTSSTRTSTANYPEDRLPSARSNTYVERRTEPPSRRTSTNAYSTYDEGRGTGSHATRSDRGSRKDDEWDIRNEHSGEQQRTSHSSQGYGTPQQPRASYPTTQEQHQQHQYSHPQAQYPTGQYSRIYPPHNQYSQPHSYTHPQHPHLQAQYSTTHPQYTYQQNPQYSQHQYQAQPQPHPHYPQQQQPQRQTHQPQQSHPTGTRLAPTTQAPIPTKMSYKVAYGILGLEFDPKKAKYTPKDRDEVNKRFLELEKECNSAGTALNEDPNDLIRCEKLAEAMEFLWNVLPKE